MKKIVRLLQLCLLGVLIFSLVMLGRQVIGSRAAAKDYDQAAQIAGLPQRRRTIDPLKNSLSTSQSGQSEEDEEPVTLNLEALQEVNGDVVGWIEIPDTELSYPLLQGTNNQYYLTHTWSREYSPAGSIYLDRSNSPDFSDFHTIIYGHRMFDNSMFGTLKYYNKQSFWEEHPSLYVTLAGGVYRFDIFAAYEASVFSVVYEYGPGREQELIRTALNSSVISTGITPETDGHILTLSTCTQFNQANRWVVQARLAQVYDPDSPDLPW